MCVCINIFFGLILPYNHEGVKLYHTLNMNRLGILRLLTACVYPDVISIEKTGEHFRLIYDVKGRFAVHRITAEEAKVRPCKG